METTRIMNRPPSGPFDTLTVPSLLRDFDSGPVGLPQD